MNRLFDATKLQADEYPLLINGRNRFDLISPSNLPTEIRAGLPSDGNIQGIYAAGNFIICFIHGKAYVASLTDVIESNIYFRKIAGFQLDFNTKTIWVCAVPYSTRNYVRKLADAADKSAGVTFGDNAVGTPACLVVQDGINQPRLIFPNGTSRKAKNYNEWTYDNPEYVPTGKQMMFHGEKLYIVSPDGLKVYHSVSGRPLDFVVGVDTNGEKAGTESEGGALANYFAVSYLPITCISNVASADGSFLITTASGCWSVTPDTTNTVFGEPTFPNVTLFEAGAVNNNSLVDILGDTAFIDVNGIRSFNAISQYRWKGENAPFSAKIQDLFHDIVQNSDCAAIVYDNYALFSVDTTLGSGILIFDTLSKMWCGIDFYPGVAKIKQFCVVQMPKTRRLFFATVDDRVYEAFSGDEAKCVTLVGDNTTGNPQQEQQPKALRVVMTNVEEAGEITATLLTSDKPIKTLTQKINLPSEVDTSEVSPEHLAILQQLKKTRLNALQPITFDVSDCGQGWKVGVLLSWNCKASLSHVMIETEDTNMQSSVSQQAATFEEITNS